MNSALAFDFIIAVLIGFKYPTDSLGYLVLNIHYSLGKIHKPPNIAISMRSSIGCPPTLQF